MNFAQPFRITRNATLFLIGGLTLFQAMSCAEADAPTAGNPPQPPKFALLVGCTKYNNCPNVQELWGPRNDVPNFARLLQSRYAFDPKEIQMLVDWPGDPAASPTRDNIVAALERIANAAKDGSQVVILMSGHGMQVPDDNNDEKDGLDEVFLPSDVGEWTNNNLPNAIRDDEFGKWFDKLRENGAHVWVIYDCCHSGTMTRAVASAERVRSARPQDLGIPAVALAAKAANNAEYPERPLDVSTKTRKGSLTEFYAAQSFEEAPELPRPADAPRTPENYYGLFTYMLVQILEQRSESLSYADLSRAIANGYRTERGTRSPTPFFAGDLNVKVLGTEFLPRLQPLRLEKHDHQFRIPAGELQGITPGSILSILAGGTENSQPLGHVRVIETTAASSIVEACEYNKIAAVPLDQIPQDAHCKLVFRDIGDMRVKVFIRRPTDPAAADFGHILDKALQQMPADTLGLVDLNSTAEDAQWILHVATPQEAFETYGRKVEQHAAILMPVNKDPRDEHSNVAKLLLVYTAKSDDETKDAESLANQIAGDLQKIFAWQNIWRVAGQSAGLADGDLQLKITRLNPPKNPATADDPNVFHVGDKIRVDILNQGNLAWWVALLHLDPHFGIEVCDVDKSIPAGKSMRALEATIRGDSLGPEGLVLIAAPQKNHKAEPRYNSLEQMPLDHRAKGVAVKPPPETPFGKLMAGAATGKATRGLEVNSPSQPAVVIRSWTTLPGK